MHPSTAFSVSSLGGAQHPKLTRPTLSRADPSPLTSPENFHVAQIIMGEEPRVVIHGNLTVPLAAKVRTVVDGLLQLRPSCVIVEVEHERDVSLLCFFGKGRYSTVRVVLGGQSTESPNLQDSSEETASLSTL